MKGFLNTLSVESSVRTKGARLSHARDARHRCGRPRSFCHADTANIIASEILNLIDCSDGGKNLAHVYTAWRGDGFDSGGAAHVSADITATGHGIFAGIYRPRVLESAMACA